MKSRDRYHRWEFDIALVWRASDEGVEEARFVWDSDSQPCGPKFLDNPEATANYCDEVGSDKEYEVTDAQEIGEAIAALALKPQPDRLLDDLADLRAQLKQAAGDLARLRAEKAEVAATLDRLTCGQCGECASRFALPVCRGCWDKFSQTRLALRDALSKTTAALTLYHDKDAGHCGDRCGVVPLLEEAAKAGGAS